ncbi:MAG TPA: cellulase family glycosylhydrolase, partial [Chloroflexota bacterium]|nr:cellulase family glycosylhydrolase [Chloroflexota bacterium]
MRRIATLGLVTLLLVAACAPSVSPTALMVSAAAPVAAPPSRVAPAPEASPVRDSRYFAETGFRIGNRYFAKFFRERGGLRNFGPPISRQFRYLGFPAQLFQNRMLLLNGSQDNSVYVVPLGNSQIFPFTQMDGMVLPDVDPTLLASMPQDPNAPDYAQQTLARTLELVADDFNGIPINFRTTYLGSVTYEEAFPNADQPQELLPYLAFQLWGRPLSYPTPDPNNGNRIYQRFENGVMMYDATTGQTTSLPLGSYFKALLTGQNLPADLEQAAQGTRFLRVYQDGAAAPAVARPDDFPDTNLADAFTPEPAPTDWAALGITYTSAPFRASSPDYGISVFLWGEPDATARTLQLVKDLGFTWIRQMFQWRDIEGVDKGVFDWSEADRIVQAANAQGLKIIARFDYSPEWSQTKPAPNGPPDDMNDFGDFVYAFVQRYGPSRGGPGRVDAIQVWNEPNLSREWGGRPINQDQAAEYVRMLQVAYQAAKQADPQITVISAGLTPTGTDDDTARPDDVYLQWLYDQGAAAYFDVLGAHGAGYKAPPEMSPEEVAADPSYGGHPSFSFRRVEQLRQVMERNGDGGKQIWLLEFGWTSDEVH